MTRCWRSEFVLLVGCFALLMAAPVPTHRMPLCPPGGLSYFDELTNRRECCADICESVESKDFMEMCRTKCPGYHTAISFDPQNESDIMQPPGKSSSDTMATTASGTASRSNYSETSGVLIGIGVGITILVIDVFVFVMMVKYKAKQERSRKIAALSPIYKPLVINGDCNGMPSFKEKSSSQY